MGVDPFSFNPLKVSLCCVCVKPRGGLNDSLKYLSSVVQVQVLDPSNFLQV